MIYRVLLICLFLVDIILESLSKKLILLPYYSKLCNISTSGVNKFYDFTLNQQLNFETTYNISNVLSNLQSTANETKSYLPWQTNENEESQFYYCRILLKPMGREIEAHHDKGEFTFWSFRIQINNIQYSKSCSDHLYLQFRHKENLISNIYSHSAQTLNISCNSSLPIIIPSRIRKLYITYFAPSESDFDNSGFSINVTTFVYFQGDFSLQFQRDLCRQHDGFWCGNQTNHCLFREMKCDGFDSCFDGGSDEENCTMAANWTIVKNNIYMTGRSRSVFIDYLPWLALGILPLILLMALVCICNQHRSEVFFDGYEDNLDLDKSHDDNNIDQMWSSIDDIDQVEKTEGRKNEIPEDAEENEEEEQLERQMGGTEPLIGLQTVSCSATVKAEIATSCTANSLNKDYEDMENAAVVLETNSEKNNSTNPVVPNEIVEEDPFITPSELLLSNIASGVTNTMTASQITDDDYVLEDVGSLLRKVDKSKIPEELRINSLNTSLPDNENPSHPQQSESVLDYRSDYILV